MNNAVRKAEDWSAEDEALAAEFADVIPLVREELPPAPKVPNHLRRRVLAMAAASTGDDLDQQWLLGQGPRVILVTLLLFAIAMAFLAL